MTRSKPFSKLALSKQKENKMKILEMTKMINGKSFNAESFYLEYFNDFLTVSKIAEKYEISESEAKSLIKFGREINHKR